MHQLSIKTIPDQPDKNHHPEAHSLVYGTRARVRQLWQSGVALRSTAGRDEMVRLVRGVAA